MPARSAPCRGCCGNCGKHIPIPTFEEAINALKGSEDPVWHMGHLMRWYSGTPDEGDGIEAIKVRCKDCGGEGFAP